MKEEVKGDDETKRTLFLRLHLRQEFGLLGGV
jgi:hypothetical protein